MANITFQGSEELTKALVNLADKSILKGAVQSGGANLQKTMMRKAEFTKGYQTGTTKRSITIAITDGGLSAEVGPTTHYAPYLEYGTRFMEAQPFVKPALDEVGPQFEKEILKTLDKG